MEDEKKFQAFKQRAVDWNEENYGREIREKYGDVPVDEAHRAVLDLTREQYQTWTGLGQEILERLSAAVAAGADPEGEEGRQITALHRQWLSFTGTRYDGAMHRGLAELYVTDPRFTGYYDRERPGCARFLRDAVARWAE